MKRKSKPEKAKAQFNRTVNRTSKWRGKKPAAYVKVKSGTKHKKKLFAGL
jgi:hypothetical protein